MWSFSETTQKLVESNRFQRFLGVLRILHNSCVIIQSNEWRLVLNFMGNHSYMKYMLCDINVINDGYFYILVDRHADPISLKRNCYEFTVDMILYNLS